MRKFTHSDSNYISMVYTMEYELSFANNYKWSKCGKCFNWVTGREIKQSYKSGCIGYYIGSKFYSLKFLRTHLIKIKNQKTPF